MAIPGVRVDQGRFSPQGIICGVAAILLNPADATLVSLIMALAPQRRGPWPLVMNPLNVAVESCAASIVCSALAGSHAPSFVVRAVVLVLLAIAIIVLTSTGLGVRDAESPIAILKRNLRPALGIALAYFALAALLMSYVLDGSVLGYVLATIVCVLSLALTDSISGRRIRGVLESEISDADRHLFHSRAVDGVVHNLRNHIATVDAYLKEIDPRKLDAADQENFATATVAADDAVSVLRTLAQGATPKVRFAPNPIDLGELAAQAAGLARSRARAKEIHLLVHEAPRDVRVKADPLLMREVMTNLVNNAIDAAPHSGRVEIHTGHRNNGWPYVSVTDNGPGVPEESRHHLFEPHYTTKEGGTGLGLFMSYGVVREHQGELSYTGSGRGATFSVALPPFSS
jgi:signal transduction histidine kinase